MRLVVTLHRSRNRLDSDEFLVLGLSHVEPVDFLNVRTCPDSLVLLLDDSIDSTACGNVSRGFAGTVPRDVGRLRRSRRSFVQLQEHQGAMPMINVSRVVGSCSDLAWRMTSGIRLFAAMLKEKITTCGPPILCVFGEYRYRRESASSHPTK